MGVKYSDLPRTNTVHMDDRVAVLSSTDDILKTVPAGSLGGVFVGTSAQWAALTAEQKAQYDQKQVILTDGEGGGFNPVEITYADWMTLPPAQRNAGTWLVTGFPVATNADLIPYTGDVQAANVGAAINALNQNLTKINTTTKTLWGYINGVWTDLHIKAYYDSIPIWVDGAFGIEVDNGIYHSDATGTPEPYVPEDTLLKFNLYANYQASLVSHDLIDFSAYSKLKVTINTSAEYQVDISDVSTSGYVFVYTSITSSTAYFGMGVSTTKNAFYTNKIKAYTTTSATSSNFFIRQIVLE